MKTFLILLLATVAAFALIDMPDNETVRITAPATECSTTYLTWAADVLVLRCGCENRSWGGQTNSWMVYCPTHSPEFPPYWGGRHHEFDTPEQTKEKDTEMRAYMERYQVQDIKGRTLQCGCEEYLLPGGWKNRRIVYCPTHSPEFPPDFDAPSDWQVDTHARREYERKYGRKP